MLSKDRVKRVIDTVVAASKADEVSVTVGGDETTHLRFARNTPSTSGNYTNRSVSVRSTFGKRSGAVSVNQLDDATLADAVARSEAIAKLAPQDPETMPGLGPQSYVAVDAYEQDVVDSGGTGTTADLIKDTKRGVLITSLWYIRGVDPRTMLYTGLTRDGVFLIENGEITAPLTNFRWNDSPIAVLKGIEAMSATARVSPRARRMSTIMVPAVRVKEFELSSVSDAV